MFMERSIASNGDHPLKGSSPADSTPRFGDDPVNILEIERLAELQAAEHLQRTLGDADHACDDCNMVIPRGRVEALKPRIPKRCTICQEKYEKKFPRRPDSFR
jgi:RNA polymerase-binding transcription factor DksA